MRKTRDLFRKFGEIKGKFSTKMDTRKDRHGKGIKEYKNLRKGGKNTQKYFKKRS